VANLQNAATPRYVTGTVQIRMSMLLECISCIWMRHYY